MGQPPDHLDPGKRAGWEQRAVKGLNKYKYSKMQVQGGLKFMASLRRAARLRGLSPPAYMRRATAAFVAADLDESFKEILSDSAHPDWMNRKGEHGRFLHTLDDGEGYGSWDVK